MQRKGRSGHAQFRLVVQDSRFHPSSGRVVAYVGSYDPHTKAAILDGEKIGQYLQNGAQPSDRVAKLLSSEGIKLPEWFKVAAPKTGSVRKPDKRRSTRPEQPEAPTPAAEASAEPAEEIAPAEDVQAPETEEAPATEEPAVDVEAPAEEAVEPAAKAGQKPAA